MLFYLSTIADIQYEWDEENQLEDMHYVHYCGPLAKENGLGLELAEFCLADNCQHPDRVKAFFEENVKNYVGNLVYHAPYNELFPHAIEPKVVEVAYQRYEASYLLCEQLGIPKMVAHANQVPSLYYPEWFVARQIRFWKRFLTEHPGKCMICLENVMEADPKLLTDIVKGVDDPRLRLCLDVGHANLQPTPLTAWLTAMGPYLSHLHIHNNEGPVAGAISAKGDLHRGLGNGQIPMEEILRKAEELNPELTATIESVELEESIEWLKQHDFIRGN